MPGQQQPTHTNMAHLVAGTLCAVILLLFGGPSTVHGHSWMLDPPAHYQLFPRNGVVNTPCEPYSSNHKPMKVTAGEEITLRWGAMGHAGGYVRLSLARKFWLSFDVPPSEDGQSGNDGSGTEDDTVIFASNVIKYECFGGGDCPTCVNDDRPYGTKLVIPINLPDGIYTLQMWATGVGTGIAQSFSCSDLHITGGDDSITCPEIDVPEVNITQSLDQCWSCLEDNPDSLACRPPHLVEGGFGAKWGKFCYPENPVVKKPKMELIGFATHELGSGDTLLGIAKTFQCCCTAEDIATATGWGDVSGAIIEMQFQTLIAQRDVIVPFFGDRRKCTPADPADFVNSAPRRGPRTVAATVAAVLTSIAAVAGHSLMVGVL